jgi:hypothetical protein
LLQPFQGPSDSAKEVNRMLRIQMALAALAAVGMALLNSNWVVGP